MKKKRESLRMKKKSPGQLRFSRWFEDKQLADMVSPSAEEYKLQELDRLEELNNRLEKENSALRWTMVLAYAAIVGISIYWCWRVYFA